MMVDRGDYKLTFIVIGSGINSRFCFSAIPRVGEIWQIPLGTYNYDFRDGMMSVEILAVEVSPAFTKSIPTDVFIKCKKI